MKKKILIVSQYFYPEQFRVNDLAEALSSIGYDVTVLTGIPNYPSGKKFNGYSFFPHRDKLNNVKIIRIPIITRGKGKIRLALNYFSFVISGGIWSIITKVKADIVFTYEVSPMTQALPSIWYAKRHKIPSVLYVTDLWPENLQIVGGVTNKQIISIVEKMVNYIYTNSNWILTASKSFINNIHDKFGELSHISFWPQYAEEFYRPIERGTKNEIPLDDKLNLTFAGNIGKAQGLEILPKAARILKKEGIPVRFNIIGDGRFKEELIKMVEEFQLEDLFNFIDSKPATSIPQYLANSDAAIITLSNNELFDMTIPAKVQSTMACGIPVLGALNGEAAEIFSASNAGLVTSSGNVEGYVKIIKMYYMMSDDKKEMMKLNARKYYLNNFEKTNLINKLDGLFEKLGGK